jgi:predicted dehydrogenase
MSRKIRLATYGTGYFSRFQYEAWMRMAEVEVVALCNRTEAKGRELAETYGIPRVFTDFAEMLDAVTPDLVDIITPPTTHLDAIKSAAARRVPIVCQKPFCRNLAEAEAAVQIAAKSDTLLAVHENFRFQPWHRETRSLLRDGALGEPYQISFRLRPGDGQGPEAYLDRQPYFQTMERFLVHETAIHQIDTFRFLMGEVTEVAAWLQRLNPAIAGEDAGIILFEFASGARGLFDGNRLVDHAAENRRLTMGEMLIEGSDAVLRLDGDGRLFLRGRGENDEQEVAYEWENRGFGGDCVYAFQRHVVDHLLGRGELLTSAGDYLANLRVEQAVYDSDRLGRRVRPTVQTHS